MTRSISVRTTADTTNIRLIIPFFCSDKETYGKRNLKTRHPGTKEILTKRASAKQ